MSSLSLSKALVQVHRRRGALGTEMRRLTGLALPVIGAQLANMSMYATDVLMAGRLSARDLAAIAVGTSYFLPIYLFSLGVLMVINPIVGHLHGAGRTAEAGSLPARVFHVAVLLAVPGIWLLWQAPAVLPRIGIEPDVAALAARYLRGLSYGYVFGYGFIVLRFFNDGLGSVRGYTLVLVASVPVNALGNLVLMYGYLGFPAMGAEGTGYASAIVMTLSFLGLAWWTKRRHSTDMDLVFLARPNAAVLREVLSLGIPNGITMCMEVSMFAVMTLCIGRLGTYAVGAHQVAVNIATFAYMLPLGISLAVGIRTAHGAGRGDMAAVRLSGLAGFVLICCVQIVLASLMVWGAPLWVGLYTTDAVVTERAVALLSLAALFQLGDGLQILGVSGLRGLKDTRVPMLCSLVCYWGVGMPLGWYLGMTRGMGVAGFWIGMVAALSLAAVAMNARFFTLSKR